MREPLFSVLSAEGLNIFLEIKDNFCLVVKIIFFCGKKKVSIKNIYIVDHVPIFLVIKNAFSDVKYIVLVIKFWCS